jgi:hypothetical protein
MLRFTASPAGSGCAMPFRDVPQKQNEAVRIETAAIKRIFFISSS